MHDDVGPVIDCAQQNWSGYRVVDNQWNTVPMRDIRQRFKVADVPGRISDAFAEDGSRVFVHHLLHGGGLIALGKSNLDPKPRQDVSK